MSTLSSTLTQDRPLRRKPRMSALIERFRPAAEELSKADLVMWRGATLLIIANVLYSLKRVGGDLADLARRVDVSVEDFITLPDLARAVHYAHLEVTGYVDVPADQTPYQRLLRLREIGLLTARLGAVRGIIPVVEVDNIAEGQGKKNYVNDGAQLDKLFSDYPNVLGTDGILMTADEAEELGDIAHELLDDLVEPQHKAQRETRRIYPLVERRNRLYSLLYRRWQRFTDAVIARDGKEKADELVIGLQSRVKGVKVNEEDIELPELDEDISSENEQSVA